MTYTRCFSCFDLAQIADSGQCFRMARLPERELSEHDRCYRIISDGKLLFIRQNGSSITFDCNSEEELTFWLHYFDCEQDYEAVINRIDPDDAYLTAAAKAGRGIRILRQNPWEMVIAFVISQQKTIPAIRALVEALSCQYGTSLGDGLFAFPAPRQLAKASLEDLLALKLGYRAKYIQRLVFNACEGRLDFKALSAMDYEQSMEYLTGFYGIGKKVANCICLFGLHHIEAFPVDTWIQKILMAHYFDAKKYRHLPESRLYEQIIEDSFGQYDGCAGILQQYIFYYERLIQNRLK